jgi:type I restriction enzyme M protein
MSSQQTADGQELEEGKLIDFWTGKKLNETPEEKVRQEYEQILTKDYGYSEELCDIEVSVEVGSDTRRADGVVYETESHSEPYIVLETKSEDKKDGIGQLKSYMKGDVNKPGATWSPSFGVWTNGDDIVYLYREPGTDDFEELPDIPQQGEGLGDIGQYTKDELVPATNLDSVFKKSIDYIYGNQGLQRPVAFNELLKLIFVKMHDERRPDETCEFRVSVREANSSNGPKIVRSRIESLFEEVKDKYSDVFEPNDAILLSGDVLLYVVGQLQKYDLLNTDLDVKGSAFENVVGSNLKGDRGEFFTPREVVHMTVEMLDVEHEEKVIDPACGSGGFLIAALNNVRDTVEETYKDRLNQAELERMKSESVRDYFYGIDFNPDLAKTAKMNMVMNQDGHENVVSENSLVPPEQWSDKAQRKIEMESFDVVITNPPFGADIPITRSEILSQYSLGHKWRKIDGEWVEQNELKNKEAPEVLFIERSLELLDEGGRMGIVVPDGILGNPEKHGYVRKFIEDNAKVLAVVDLPVETFLPQVGARTSVLFLEKHSGGVDEEYDIFMAVAEKVGSDRRGKTIYRTDEKGNYLLDDDGDRIVANDLPDIIEEYEDFKEGDF